MNEAIKYVDEAIRSRHSMRRYLPKPVSQGTVRELLELAACAPSGTNVQPWRVYALSGEAKNALSAAIMAKHVAGETDGGRELDYYPKEWVEPWLSRRRKCGLGLYSLPGIQKGDTVRMKEQAGRNYIFFDAPVGLIFTLDNRLGKGMLVDCGMFLGNLMTAARAASIPARRLSSPITTRRSAPISAFRTTKSSIAAWRSATPTRTRRKIN